MKFQNYRLAQYGISKDFRWRVIEVWKVNNNSKMGYHNLTVQKVITFAVREDTKQRVCQLGKKAEGRRLGIIGWMARWIKRCFQHGIRHGSAKSLAVFGDSLFLNLDLSRENIPELNRLQIGEAMLDVSPLPYNGCMKFKTRFGWDALWFVSMPQYRRLTCVGYICVLSAEASFAWVT